MESNCRVCLYGQIAALRRCWHIRDPFDPFLIADTLPGVELYETPFASAGLRGLLVTSHDKSGARIILNARRSAEEQMFDLSHELVHFALHPPTDTVHGYSPFMEWQANEGAAELLLPRTLLLHLLAETRERIRSPYDASRLIQSLARRQGIRESVIRWRVWSLRQDAALVLAGTDPDCIPLLPQRRYPSVSPGPVLWFFPSGHIPASVIQ